MLTLMILGSLSLVSCIKSIEKPAPKGWYRAGGRPSNYEMNIDKRVKHGGKASAYIKLVREKYKDDEFKNLGGFGTLMQTFMADEYRGKRVRMSAWMKSKNVDSANLWMRLDAERRTSGFDNMRDRSVKGTTGWKKYEVVLDVTEDTLYIAFGGFVSGKGEAWIDDFIFEEVSKDVPTTNIMPPQKPDGDRIMQTLYECPKQPLNLNFEEE